MKTLSLTLMLAAGAFALCGLAGAQTAMPGHSHPSAEAPAGPGASKSPDAVEKAPSTSGSSSASGESGGAVVTPPKTGTEGMVTQPKNVDPGMSGATGKVDRKKKQEIEGATGGAAKGAPEYK